MLKKYLKIAVRNIVKNKIFSFINIVGLSISIAISFCIFVFIIYELSYDKHHKNYDHIYRLESQWKDADFRTPMSSIPLAETIKKELPEIKDFVRLQYKNSLEFEYNNTSIKIIHNYFADPSIFNIFSYSFIEGDAGTFASKTNSIILSKSTALKLFGTTKNVLGKVISFKYDSSMVDVEIAGVIRDENLPATIVPNTIIPLSLLQKIDSFFTNDDWGQLQRVFTYLLIDDNVDIKSLEKKIRKINNERTANIPNYVMDVSFFVVPLSETYFIKNLSNIPKFMPVINKNKIIIYSAIAVAILLMACINFVLLTSAKISTRYLEFGIRKVIGAQKRDIFYQTILESVLTLLLTIPLTIVFIELIFPYFQDIINIQIKPSFYTSLIYVSGLIALNVFIGIVSGFYISILIYKTKPTDIFNKKLSANFSNAAFRKILLLFQFAVFITLLISMIVLKYQMNYMYGQKLGFDNTNVVSINCKEIKGKEEVFKNQVVQRSGILDYAFTFNVFPLNRGNRFQISGEKNPNDRHLMVYPLIGNKYPSFSKMELIAGKFPDNNKPKIIINETAARLLGYKNPIGKNILLFGKYRKKIIAVVKDFHINTFRDKIMPVAMLVKDFRYRLILRIAGDKVDKTLNFIKTQWSKFSDTPLNYQFAEDRLSFLYKKEIRFEKLIDFFTAIAILISTMGLFGLVMFSVRQRTKEIGIRKVLGASVSDILKFLSKDFLILVLFASILASPLAYYLMNNWLENFAYRIKITPEIFIVALAFSLFITAVTIVLQGVKTALSNPVDSWRSE